MAEISGSSKTGSTNSGNTLGDLGDKPLRVSAVGGEVLHRRAKFCFKL
jgi:hypothetical protein